MPRSASSRGRAALASLVAAILLGLLAAAIPPPASAHSLDSSTIAVVVGEDAVRMTVSLPLATLDTALGTGHATEDDVTAYAPSVIAYIDDHLTVTGADGTAWAETYSDAEAATIEGVRSFSVVVTLDPGDDAPDRFTIAYDAIIEAVAGHDAVVVLTDSAGKISSPGIITAGDGTLGIRDGAGAAGAADMLVHGFHHVLLGADHLLFLVALLLPAPLVARAGRWTPGDGASAAGRRIVHVVTAFTVGHSITLMAAALGWVSVPARPVEVLIAASVGVAAIHAARPLTPGGEARIAAAFGLVHGLAFAGILAGLGLEGTASVPALLAFNAGIELAQLATVALVYPSLHVLSRTRWYPAARVAAAGVAFALAAAWALERLGAMDNPLAVAEDAAIGHPWHVVAGLAGLAAAARLADRSRPAAPGHA